MYINIIFWGLSKGLFFFYSSILLGTSVQLIPLTCALATHNVVLNLRDAFE